jgi:hypothetical protein
MNQRVCDLAGMGSLACSPRLVSREHPPVLHRTMAVPIGQSVGIALGEIGDPRGPGVQPSPITGTIALA